MKRKRPCHAEVKARKRAKAAAAPIHDINNGNNSSTNGEAATGSTHLHSQTAARDKIVQPPQNSKQNSGQDDAILRVYYPSVQLLRSYLAARVASKKRRKAILECGTGQQGDSGGDLGKLLDRVYVGTAFDGHQDRNYAANQENVDPSAPTATAEAAAVAAAARRRPALSRGPPDVLDELRVFTQRVALSAATAGSTPTSSQALSVAHIVDYCVWHLFRRHPRAHNPPHLLCHGFVRDAPAGPFGRDLVPGAGGGIRPGDGGQGAALVDLRAVQENPFVRRLKSAPWTGLSALLGAGRSAELLLVELFCDCGLFEIVEAAGRGTWLQISGTPLNDLSALDSRGRHGNDQLPSKGGLIRPLNSIRFVRHRILYGKPILNARKGVTFGHRPIHILNRNREPSDKVQTVMVMKYVFPRQFGLHNAFTSLVSKEESAQPFLDYTLRDDELRRHDSKTLRKHAHLDACGLEKKRMHLPKCLRGKPFELVASLQRRHLSCPYVALLEHYCPLRVLPQDDTQQAKRESSIFTLATPVAQVSAYCRSVVNKVVPGMFWGDGTEGAHNKSVIMRAVDNYIRLGRYESLTMHSITHGYKYSAATWTHGPNTSPDKPASLSQTSKQRELTNEFLYWLVDSFLNPLLSTNFYVTESSSSQRNRLLFFRQDAWARLSEPALATLRLDMFAPVPPAVRKRLERKGGAVAVGGGALAVGRVRLVPKDSGLRPIVNLRRRAAFRVAGGRKVVLGKSVNSALRPAFDVLTLVRKLEPALLGCSVFSADEIWPRLQRFRARLREGGVSNTPLYFAAVDVRQCFDSIPQDALLELLAGILERHGAKYTTGRHAVGKLLRSHADGVEDRVAWKYRSEAMGAEHDGAALTTELALQRLLAEVSEGPGGRGGSRILVDKVVRRHESGGGVLATLVEHITNNLVLIGKQVCRQKVGIAQGSVVSSLLCSLFYGALDASEQLSFVRAAESTGQCMVVRLIDDFLLVSTNRAIAERFVRVMHQGMPVFGVSIKAEKSRTNFPLAIQGRQLGKLDRESDFPYCGLAINTANLNVSSDVSRRQRQDLRSAVTVEHAKTPGKTFYRKVLDMAKLHMHGMLLSTSFNDSATVMRNLHEAFKDMGQRCLYYMDGMRCSSRSKIGPAMVIRTLEDLIRLSFALIKKQRRSAGPSVGAVDGGGSGQEAAYACAISRVETQRTAYEALLAVFWRRRGHPTGSIVVEWLRLRLAEA